MLVGVHVIVHGCRRNHRREDDNRPVHTRRIRIRARREETHHKAHNEESQSHIVNRAAPFPQGPTAREQGLFAQALEADEADGGDVRDQQGSVGEGDDGVEGDAGAEVQGCDGEADAEDDDDRVHGDVPARADLQGEVIDLGVVENGWSCGGQIGK